MAKLATIKWLLIWALLLHSTSGQKKNRQKPNGRASSKRERPTETLQNICNIDSVSTGMYCYCDSLATQDATTANCWIFETASPTDLIWESFQNQANLRELRLGVRRGDGRLTFVPDSAFGHLTNLTRLSISEGDLNILEPRSFASATVLRNLTLEKNNINELRPDTFGGLSNLYSLVLSSNELENIERGHLDGLDHLHVLWLDHNRINLIADNAFVHLNRLIELDLSGNQISVLTPDTLAGLARLESLYLQNNQLSIIGDGTFTQVTRLRRLELQSNQIRVIRDASFQGLKHLTYLDLRDNQLIELGQRTWSQTPHLVHLNLANNRLVSLNHSTFSPLWSNLMDPQMTFDVSGNPVVCDCSLYWMMKLDHSSSSSVKTALDSLSCPPEQTPRTLLARCRSTSPAKSVHKSQPHSTVRTEATELWEVTESTTRPISRYESVNVASHSLETTQLAINSSRQGQSTAPVHRFSPVLFILAIGCPVYLNF